MLDIDIPQRAPASFLFFVAAAIAAYYSQEQSHLRWFSYSAIAFFVALGPIHWIEETAYSLRKVYRGEDDKLDDPHLWGNKGFLAVGYVFGGLQFVMFILGLFFVVRGFFSAS